MKTKVMNDADNMDLKEMYNILLNNGNIYVPKTHLEASTVEVYGEIYDSKSSSSPRASHIISSWFSEGNIVNDI